MLRVRRRDRKERVRIVMCVRGAAFAYKVVNAGLYVRVRGLERNLVLWTDLGGSRSCMGKEGKIGECE